MPTVITEILGSDAFSGSRVIINANFQALKNTLDDVETNFGLSILSGNIDVSTATGGEIKAKQIAVNNIFLPAAGTANITLTGATGAMVGKILTLGTSLSVPTATIDNLTCTNLGSSVFNGEATFNQLVKLYDGVARNHIDIGAVAAHTVLNSDCVVIFEPASLSPPSLVLTPDASLVDGHEITLIDKGNNPTVLDSSNILGFASGSITFSGSAYKSAITLMWSVTDSAWIITNSSNMTIV